LLGKLQPPGWLKIAKLAVGPGLAATALEVVA